MTMENGYPISADSLGHHQPTPQHVVAMQHGIAINIKWRGFNDAIITYGRANTEQFEKVATRRAWARLSKTTI